MHGLPFWRLLAARARGMGAVQLTPPESPPPPLSPLSPLSLFQFWSSLLYLLTVSQRPHTIIETSRCRVAVLDPSFLSSGTYVS